MIIDKNISEGKDAAERLLSCLTMCHNILRSQEGMSQESAFRELNRLLFVKYVNEKEGANHHKYGFGYSIQHGFDEVKRMFEHEHLFNLSERLESRPASYEDVLGTLSDFRFSLASQEMGKGYVGFVQKMLRNISDEPIITSSVSDFIADYLNEQNNCHVADPFCGYGGLITNLKGDVFGCERNAMLAQTAKMNLLMHGNDFGGVERDTDATYSQTSKFDCIVTCIKHRERTWEDVYKVFKLLAYCGKAVLLMPDEILQKEQNNDIRKYLLERHTVKAILSLPANAVRTRNRLSKWSVLFVEGDVVHSSDTKTLIAKVENVGVSNMGLPTEKNDFDEIKNTIYHWIQNGFVQSGKKAMTVNLYSLTEWNIEAEFLKEENRYMSQYPLYKLWELAEIESFPLEKLYNDNYKQVTVRKNQHDVVLRDCVKDKDIKYPNRQSVVRSGQILVSRINAKEGAIGIVPKNLDGAIVSDNFVALTVNSQVIDPYYLLMVLTSKRYQKILKGISRGATVRSYIKNTDLMGLEIPVPAINKQRELTRGVSEIQMQIYQLEENWKKGIDRFSKELFGL